MSYGFKGPRLFSPIRTVAECRREQGVERYEEDRFAGREE